MIAWKACRQLVKEMPWMEFPRAPSETAVDQVRLEIRPIRSVCCDQESL